MWLRWPLRLFFRLFYGYRVRGLEHLPPEGPYLVAPNHQSYFDPFVVAITQDEGMCFMAWEALFRNRRLGRFLHWMGAFPVSLDRNDPVAIRRAMACLRAGRRVLIFPEGQRTWDGRLQPLREGVAHLALHFKCPIVPVRIEGAWEAWPRTRRFPGLHRPITVTIEPPVLPPPERLPPAERRRAAEAMLRTLSRRLEGRGAADGEGVTEDTPPDAQRVEEEDEKALAAVEAGERSDS